MPFQNRPHINREFFRKVGELLGHLQLIAKRGEEVFASYDPEEDEVKFMKASNALYHCSIIALEIASSGFSPRNCAEVINYRWEEMK